MKRRRQNPISCRFCREKKLKCDRQSPCSSCSSRGLPCTNISRSQPRSPLPGQADHASILERLRHLESLVLNQETRIHSSGPQFVPIDASGASAGPWRSPATPVVQGRHGDVRHGDVASQETPASEYAETVRSLEGTGLQRDPWLPTDAGNIQIRVATIQHIALLNSDPGLREMLLQRPTVPCTLPTKEEAVVLLDYYMKHLEDLQHIMYIPTVQGHMHACYADLANGQPVNVGVLILLISIFASASILMSHHPGDQLPLFSRSDGARLSMYWANCALDMLKYQHNKSCDVLEVIQATILLRLLLVNVEGLSTRVHSYFAFIVSRARDLSLHKIDAVGSSAPRDAIHTEIKRRVWWYIVAIDWVLSLSGGPQEGTYSVQPRQMAVNIPRNIDDKDLVHTNPVIDRPLSEPTAMSHYIQRIKLANLCREVVDLIPISAGDSSTVDYQQVIALDQRFDAFLQELPIFLRNDEQSIQQSEHIVARYPQMRIQRQALSMLARTKRCKLHQPFLIRGSVDPRYSYSRKVSIESARTVIEENRRIKPLDINSHSHDRYNFGVLPMYYMFMATIVLVMDLCFNSNSNSNSIDGDDDETRVTKTEVMAACYSLHQDQSMPSLGAAYLASLMDVLRKYKVKLRPPTPPLQQPITMSTLNTDPFSNLNSNLRSYTNNFSFSNHWIAVPSAPTNLQGSLDDFDNIWNDYVELGPNLETSQWDNLFSDLGPELG